MQSAKSNFGHQVGDKKELTRRKTPSAQLHGNNLHGDITVKKTPSVAKDQWHSELSKLSIHDTHWSCVHAQANANTCCIPF